MIEPQTIADLYAKRRLTAGPALARMTEVQQMYDGDIVVPLPELNRNEKSALENRVKNGLTQFADRIASSVPTLWCPPVRPGFQNAENNANDRRRALLGWWANSKLKTRLRQRARYLQGYGASPVEIVWDMDRGVPIYTERNPLTTFPSLLSSPADICPHDCIFDVPQTLGWLFRHYPAQTMVMAKKTRAPGQDPDKDQLYTTLRYVDDNECVLVALGQKNDWDTTIAPGSMVVLLDRYENRSGRCPVVVPRQITLSKPHGQFDGMAGMHQTEAMLMAMAIIATQKGVFADEWLVANPNEEPDIVQVPNSRQGIPGIVKGGQLTQRGVDPQFQTNLTIDRLADASMRQAGLSSELQGVAPTNVRTGVRSQFLLSNVIDFPIQAAQELFCESLQEENRISIAFAKGYGSGSKSFYVTWDGEQGPVTYNPTDTFDTDENIVTFPLAGADQAGLVISGGQRLGMGTMSDRTFMKIDPLIDNPEQEHDFIIAEKLEKAILSSIEQAAASNQMPPVFVARIAELVKSNKKELFEAVTTAENEAKAQQAQSAAPDEPEAQPGLQGPAQAMQGPPAAGPPPLAQLLAGLRRPQTGMTPQEQLAGASGA